MYATSIFVPWETYDHSSSWLRKPPFQLLLYWSYQCWIKYCNSCLWGLPGQVICHLQLVQNTAARVVTLTKREHTELVLENLHWLPVKDHIIYHNILSWHTTASLVQLYNIFKSWFLIMNCRNLFHCLLSLTYIFQVWMKTIPKSSSASGLSSTLP